MGAFRFAARGILDSLRQLTRFRTGDEIRDFALNAPNWNPYIIQTIFPRDFHAFSNSRMIRGQLLRLANASAVLHTAIFWVSALACLLFARTRQAEKLSRLLISVVTFLVINAAVCATLAGVYDRYQSRVAWLIPLCMALYVVDWLERKRARIPGHSL